MSSKILAYLKAVVNNLQAGSSRYYDGDEPEPAFPDWTPVPSQVKKALPASPVLETGWQKVDVRWLRIDPTLPINSRCARLDAGIPVDSAQPEHLEICRHGRCGHRQGADYIKRAAQILSDWETDPRLRPIFQRVIQHHPSETGEYLPGSLMMEDLGFPAEYAKVLGSFFGYQRIRVDRETMILGNGRHRVCAARKFGVTRLWVWVA